MKYIALLLLLALALTGCTSTTEQDTDIDTNSDTTQKIQVAATFYPYYDLTKSIISGVGEVYSVVPPAIEPHNFEPSARDYANLQNIDVYVSTGVEFEQFEDTIISNLQSEVLVIQASKGIELLAGGHDHDHGHEEHHDEEHEESEHVDEHHEEEHESAYEWAGLFELEAGMYTWTFAKVDSKYADPEMKMSILKAEDEHGIEENEEKAEEMFNSSSTATDGGILSAGNSYALLFDQNKDVTTFSVNIETDGIYVFYTEHMPFEFEAQEHFFKNKDWINVEPIAEEPETGHDHSHEKHEDEEHADEEEHMAGTDPHVWLSVKNAITITNTIASELSLRYPEHATRIAANTNELVADLEALDLRYETGLAQCSKDTILVAHNAYQYLAKDYGFDVISISGLSPESEPTPGQLIELIEEARYHNITTVYFEELVDPRVSETIAKEVGAQTLQLNPVAGSINGKSYIDIMNDNLDKLKIGLECK